MYQAWKCILRPGRFWVQKSDGGTSPVEFTADDVRGFHAGGRQMLDRGFPVPVPLDHDDQAGPVSSADRNAAVVRNNAGWVGDYRLDEGASGPELWARLDIDGPVGMSAADVPDWIEKRVKFVSPSLWPEITLGDGTDVRLGIKHVALTCQPIDFAQKPFGVALSTAGESVPLWSASPVAVDLAWVNQPGPRSHNRWVNDETGRVVYSKTKPGSTKERIAAIEGDVDPKALKAALDPHKRRELTAGQTNRARQAWDMLKRHHGDKAMHRVREMALADIEAISRGETVNKHGANLYARLEAYRHMMALAGPVEGAKEEPKAEPAVKPSGPTRVRGRIDWDGTPKEDPEGNRDLIKAADGSLHSSKAAHDRHFAKQAEKEKADRETTAAAEKATADKAASDAERQAKHDRTKAAMEKVGNHALDTLKAELTKAGMANVAKKAKQQGGRLELPKDASDEAKAIRAEVLSRYKSASIDPWNATDEELDAKLADLTPKPQPAAQPAINLRDPQALADAVHQAGLALPHAINGEVPAGKLDEWESHKPFISDLYDAMKDRLGGASLDDFKKGLAAANQAGTLELSRLDLSNLAHAQGKNAYGRSEIGSDQDTKHVVNVNSKAARKRQPAATPASAAKPTTQPDQPAYEAAAKAVRSAYGTLSRFKEHEGGMVPAHVLYDYAKDAHPGLTPDVFKAALVGMQDSKEAELHVRNEVKDLTPEQRAVTPMQGDKARGFVILKAGKESPAAKPTPQAADAAAAVQKLWDNITDKSVTIEKIDAGIQSLADANLAPAKLKELAKSLGISRPLPSAAEAIKAIRLQLRNRKGTFVRANLSHSETKMSHAAGRTVVAATVGATKRPARVQMSHGAGPMADEPEDDLFTDSELEGDDDTSADEGEGDDAAPAELEEVAAELASLGIVVEASKSKAKFLEHLITAVRSHKATRDGGTPQVDDAAARPEPEPMSMSMSKQMESRLARVEGELAGERLKGRLKEVAQLERAGVSPERCKRWKQTLQAKQLSLAGGAPDSDVGKVLAEMEMAKEAFAEKIQLSMAREEAEPDWARWNKADDDPAASRKRQEDVGDELAALAGVRKK